MASTLTVQRSTRLPTHWSLADIQEHVGGVPIERILSFPPPGFATVEDVVQIHAKKERLCELDDGILVQKTAVFRNSITGQKAGDLLKKHANHPSEEIQFKSATITTTPRSSSLPANWNLADIQDHVGGVPLERIRSFPPPGFATVEDVEQIQAEEDRLFELIDGILVEKAMGYYESLLAGWIITAINNYLIQNPIGQALTADGALRILPDQIRIADVCFISWSRFPEGRLPREPVPHLVPDLAIEVLSESNRPGEMERKRQEYFQAGVRLVWYIDPPTRSAMVYASPEDPGTRHAETEPLSGGDVLPGFTLSLAEIFQQADSQAGR
jgi:Uma2 family endonuclease